MNSHSDLRNQNEQQTSDRVRFLRVYKAPVVLPYQSILRTLRSNAEIATTFDSLLSSFEFARGESSQKTVLVTSTQPREGKTTIAACLAITSMLAGQRVLVCDGDLRRPSLHRMFGLENKVGFADLVAGTTDRAQAIQTVNILSPEAEAKPISVIASGAATPKGFHALGAKRVRSLFRELAEDYDLILLDSPPALAVNDSALLASAVENIILVVAAGDVNVEQARRAKERLEQSGTPIVGVVLNRFDDKLYGSSILPHQRYYYEE